MLYMGPAQDFIDTFYSLIHTQSCFLCSFISLLIYLYDNPCTHPQGKWYSSSLCARHWSGFKNMEMDKHAFTHSFIATVLIEHLLCAWHQGPSSREGRQGYCSQGSFCKLGENTGEQVNKKIKMIILNAMKEIKQGKGREWSEKTSLWRWHCSWDLSNKTQTTVWRFGGRIFQPKEIAEAKPPRKAG